MEDILFTIVIIVAIICYTIYKIDCNHVNNPKNSHPTGGFTDYRSLGKPKIPKGERVPPGRCSRKPEKAPIPPRKDSE